MAIINARFWHKAYMLEFNEEGSDPKIFTFSTPPESEDLSFPQRVSETKTYGGVVFDDYGNDTVKITLSGSTFNEEEKYIYQASKEQLYLTGEKEIFALQSLIKDFGGLEKIPKKKVYLYDLSKSSMIDKFISGKVTKSYWEVKIKDFKIRRAKDKPMTYYYTLEMVANDTDKDTIPTILDGKESSEVKKQSARIQEKLTEVNEFIDNKVLLSLDVVDTIANELIQLKKTYENLNNPLDTAVKLGGDALRIVSVASNTNFYTQALKIGRLVKKYAGMVTGKKGNDYKIGTNFTERYTVSFDSNGGSLVPNQVVEFLGTAKRPTDPTREKYRFDDWYSDDSLTTVFNFSTEITSSIRLYAKWIRELVTVTFNAKNGSFPTYQSIPVGSVIEDAPTPTKPDSLFVAWCIDYECTTEFDMTTPVNEDLTLYAKYIPQYSVNFFDRDTIYETQLVKENELVIYPLTPTRENYQFEGWYTDEACTIPYDFSDTVTASFNLYAKWVQYANNVVFHSNGGTAVETQSVLIGQTATEPTPPTKEGYEFVFWCDDPDATNEYFFNTPVNSELHLYARWNVNVYTISFNSNGGSAVSADHVAHGQLLIFPDKPTKSGYVFDKWCTDEELQNEYDFETPVTEGFTLYAKWFGGNE